MNNLMLEKYLNQLKLKAIIEDYDDLMQKAKYRIEFESSLLKLLEHELNIREEKSITNKIKNAKFPNIKTMDSFDFSRLENLNQAEVHDLLSCKFIEKRRNIVAIGSSGTGKTHIATAIGIAACQKGYSTYFTNAVNLATQLIEHKDGNNYMNFKKRLSKYQLLIIDELGYISLSRNSAELLFNVLSDRYETGSIIITSNLEFAEWNNVFNNEKMTIALVDRLVHHSYVLQMNGKSYRLEQRSKNKKK